MRDASSAFFDLKPEQFPLKMYAFKRTTGEQVWSVEVADPAALFVPPLAKTHGPVRIRIEFGDGSIVDDGELIQP